MQDPETREVDMISQQARAGSNPNRRGACWRFGRRTFAVAICASILTNAFVVTPGLALNPEPNAPTDMASMSYQQVMEHAHDPNTFTPGDVVTVPYHPRRGDKTPINGHAPVALPAGTASGRSMAATPNGQTWAQQDVAAPTPAAPTPTASASLASGSGSAATSAAISTATPAATSSVTPAANTLRREVFGFLPYWESSNSSGLKYDILSTVAYFGVGVDGYGNLQKHDSDGSTSIGWAGWTSSWMTNVINNAHAHGTRVVLTIEEFAWSTSEVNEQVQLLGSAINRQNAATQIAAAVAQRGADGVNLDFEPIASSQEGDYTIFVKLLRQELNKLNPGYELTFCATGSTGYYDVAGLTSTGAADAVFIMGYDFRTGSSSYAGSTDPLTSPRPVYDLTQVINLWKARTSVSHIILGLPYYGIAWTTTTNAPNATVVQKSCIAPTSVFFAQAASLAAANGRRYDSIEQSAWTTYTLTCPTVNVQVIRELYYDDAQSLGVKYDMINYWNLRGMGIWALGYDTGHPEMAQLVADKFLNDRTPPQVGIVNMPATQTNEGFPVSWTGQDDWHGIASYDVQVSTDGGPFVDWMAGTKETSDVYGGVTGHNYSFRVRATDGVGNVSPWDVTSVYTGSPTYAIGSYVQVAALTENERSAPSATATIVATVPQGTVLHIIGGPVTTPSDGQTWYQVTGPYTAIDAVGPLFPGPWVAVTDGTTDWVVPITPPNSTAVSSGLTGYSVGIPGMLRSGTGIDRGKVFSPDGDGIRDTLPVNWTNAVAMDDVSLNIYGVDGTDLGSIDLGAQGIGPHSYTWNGKLNGSVLPDGRYMIQVAAKAGSATYYAPSAAPFGAWQMSRLAALIDTTPSGTYFPMTPKRILDTRIGLGLSGAFVAGTARSFRIAGIVPGVPANAIAVTGNLTVTKPTAGGFVSLGSSLAGATSTINFNAGEDRANGVTLGLDSNGSLSAVYQATRGATVQLIFDLSGYFVRSPSGTTFVPVSPTRIVDSRIKLQLSAPLVAGKIASFTVAGLAGVPLNAVAVTGNVTVTGSTGRGYVTLAPTIAAGVLPTSTLNFTTGSTRANNVTVQLSGGKLAVEYAGTSRTTTQLIFDVTGYFLPGLSGATFVPLSPGRVVDSRVALGFKGPLKNGATAIFAVSGQVSVHPIALAVVGNLTVTGQTSGGWLAVGPGVSKTTSTLNFTVGRNLANGFVSLIGTGGNLGVTFGGARGSTTQFVVDIVGYYR